MDTIFFTVKHSIGHILGMVDLINVKCMERELVGYFVNYETFTFDVTHDLELVFF